MDMTSGTPRQQARRPFAGRLVPAVAAAALLAACAAPTTNVQWMDRQFNGTTLRGSTLFVACDALETAVRHRCQDEIADQVTARGSQAEIASEPEDLPPGTISDAERLDAARTAGAKALFTTTIAPSSSTVSSGASIGIGLGGFGRSFGGGLGLSAPVGGGRVATGYSADGKLIDVSTGRLIWTTTVSTAPSSDVDAQLTELAKAVVDAAQRAGLL